MAEQFYYVDGANQRIGPVPWEVLVQLHQAGGVTDVTLTAPEGAADWVPFAELRRSREKPASLPPVPGQPHRTVTQKRPRKKTRKTAWIVAAVLVAMTMAIAIAGYILWIPEEYLHLKASKLSPKKVPLPEIAKAIEAMPKTYHPVPDPSGQNKGFMVLRTGENSVQVRSIPDHPGLYQIDVTRYGVVYDRLPTKLGTRNALTLVLNLGTEFKDWRWHLIEAKGGAVHQITTPRQAIPDQETIESIPLEEAMWHSKWVIDYLNSESLDNGDEKRNAAGYLSLEEAFDTEKAKIEAIRAQGIRVPE